MCHLLFQNCNVFDKACYQSTSNNCNHEPDEITLLHKNFDHPNSAILIHLFKTCKQFKVSHKAISSSMHSIYEACQLGKTCRQHFSKTKTKTSKMLELLHTDLWGLSYTVSRNGYKYYINFVDDYSKFT